ncbi:MAG: hypothetical protein LAN62_17845, partial [Acidobacteriia bacterium]|nr:hypothetical protein [Terriglobia bacterium]
IFRRAMLRRRRVAQNQLSTRPLEPGEKPPQPPGKYWEKPWATDSPRGWAKIILTLTLNALGLIILLTGAIAFLGRAATRVSASQVVLLILGLALTLGTVSGVVKSLRILKVRWKVGRVQVTLAPTEVHCGDDLNCSVEFQPAAPVQLDQATARLEAFEVAHYVRNKQPTTRLVRQHEVTLAAGRSLLAQESAVLSGKIPVPPEDPPTFLAVDHKILWFVAVRLDIAGGTKWSTDIPISVLA